ncbi:MAG: hypothetical protein LAT63_02420 [Marinobacter sp.]|nr:hypothetical protein [Marinobacter sp.]
MQSCSWLYLLPLLPVLVACGGGSSGGGGGDGSNDTKSYTVATVAGQGGSFVPAGDVLVPEGQTLQLSLTVNEGYTLYGVTGCGGSLSGTTYTTAAITADCTVLAAFMVEDHPADGAIGQVLGEIEQAVVTASHWQNGAWVPQGLVAMTDAQGRFTLPRPEVSQPIRLQLETNSNTRMPCPLSAGCGSAAYGEPLAMPEGFTLSTIVPGDRLHADTSLVLSPLTHAAAQWVEQLPLRPSNAGAEMALNQLAALFGLDADWWARPLGSLGDQSSLAQASNADMHHALVSLSYFKLADDLGIDPAGLTHGLARMFAALGGQWLVRSGDVTAEQVESWVRELGLDPDALLGDYVLTDLSVPGLDSLLAAAAHGAVSLLPTARGEAVNASLLALAEPWQAVPVTYLGGLRRHSNEALDAALIPIDDYDHYRASARQARQGMEAAHRNLGWLMSDDVAQDDFASITRVMSEAFGYLIQSSVCVPQRKNGATSCSDADARYSIDASEGYAAMVATRSSFGFWQEGELRLSGERFGSAVNLTFETFDIRDLLQGQGGAQRFYVRGSIQNGTVIVPVDLMMSLDLSQNPEANSYFRNRSLLWWTNSNNIDAGLALLLENLNLGMGLTGSGAFQSADTDIGSYSFSGLDTALRIDRRSLSGGDQPLLEVALTSIQRTNPAGETLSHLPGRPAFRLALADPAELSVGYRYTNLGLPPMEFVSGGTLAGFTPLLAVLGDYLTALLDGEGGVDDVDLEGLMSALDFSLLQLDGATELRIFDAARGHRHYRLASEPGLLMVSEAEHDDTPLIIATRGLAAYLYIADELVGIVSLKGEGGLVLNLANDSQRDYIREREPGEPSPLQALWTMLSALAEALGSVTAPESP